MKLQIKLLPAIGIDARPLSHGITGNSRYLFETIRLLAQKKENFTYHLFSNKPIHFEFEALKNNDNIKIHVRNYFNGFIWFHFYLKKMIIKEQIDMFWGTLQLLPLRKLAIPCFVNYHDLNFYKVPETMNTFNYFQHLFLSTLSLKRAKKVFCLSHSTANDIIEFNQLYKNKLEVIYPGVSKKREDQLTFDLKIEGLFFLVVGTIEPRKNIKIIVDSYLEIRRNNSKFHMKLIIAGKRGWNEKSLEKKLLSGNLESQGIKFIENPSDDALESLYRQCSFFVFPSIHEGFGLPILEAKKYNKLCIVSKIDVFKEIVDEEDKMVEPKDKNAWIESILSFSNRKNLSRNTEFDNKKWTWDKTASNLEDNFLSIWKKKRESLKNDYNFEKY